MYVCRYETSVTTTNSSTAISKKSESACARKVADALRRAQRGQNPFHRLLQEPAKEAEVFVFHVRFFPLPRETCEFPTDFSVAQNGENASFFRKN